MPAYRERIAPFFTRVLRAPAPPAGATPRLARPALTVVMVSVAAFTPYLAAAAPAGVAGAAPANGAIHVVQPGQTLFRIALTYGVPLAAILDANRLASPNALGAGRRLRIPGARATLDVTVWRPLSAAERRDLERSLGETHEDTTPPPGWGPPPPRGPGEFIWPVEGTINSSFGPRGNRRHAGVDIGSPRAQQVGAAADGEALFAGPARGGFGKVVVLEHEGGFRTVYAHLAAIIAREGESVRQGQPIGGVGTTGNATGPHLHFEIRHRGVPVDPLAYLPQTLDELMQDLGAARR